MELLPFALLEAQGSPLTPRGLRLERTWGLGRAPIELILVAAVSVLGYVAAAVTALSSRSYYLLSFGAAHYLFMIIGMSYVMLRRAVSYRKNRRSMFIIKLTAMYRNNKIFRQGVRDFSVVISPSCKMIDTYHRNEKDKHQTKSWNRYLIQDLETKHNYQKGYQRWQIIVSKTS